MFESWKIFSYPNQQLYSERLYFLNHWDEYYERDSFIRETEGMGVNPAFRALLREFINEMKPVTISEAKDIIMYAESGGRFLAHDSKRHKWLTQLPVKADDVIFSFQCFLEVNRFLMEARALKTGKTVQERLKIGEETLARLTGEQVFELVKRAEDGEMSVFFGKEYGMKILYVHGYMGSANGSASKYLKQALDKMNISADINAPSIPLENPQRTINYIKEESEKVDLVVASSMGAFYTMMVPGKTKILVNPALPENLMQLNNFDKALYPQIEKLRTEFFQNGPGDALTAETFIVLGSRDTIAPNGEFFRSMYDSDKIYELPMEHKLDETGAAKVAEIINEIFM